MKGLDRFQLERAHFHREHIEWLLFSRATSESGLPMFPQAIVRWPQAFNI